MLFKNNLNLLSFDKLNRKILEIKTNKFTNCISIKKLKPT